jgi:hypothetical protein
MSTAKDLTKEPPRSPRVRLGGYDILARAVDKGRAAIAGTVGEFHFDCPLDNMLFGFKEVKGEEVKKLLASGASDEEVAKWIDSHGATKSADEIKAWNEKIEGYKPYEDPEKKEWFTGVCSEVGIDPAKSTLFDYLDADDKATYAKK